MHINTQTTLIKTSKNVQTPNLVRSYVWREDKNILMIYNKQKNRLNINQIKLIGNVNPLIKFEETSLINNNFVYIDNKKYYLPQQALTIYQFLHKLGIYLPCFCYHERLNIAGNCRICLVEANAVLVLACATMIVKNMSIYTTTKRVIKAREHVLEFILINHPLDCPVCKQGGECDLQDIVHTYGFKRGGGRYYEVLKKTVNTSLNCFGPFIKTVMTRCIHCTRCVRFINEVAGYFEFGVLNRGASMILSPYMDNFITDELLGNIIDLCPVGALISMTSSANRPWEYKYTKSIDILDCMATNINLGVINNSIARIIPCLDEYYDEWITNKARFSFDAYNIQRLSYPKLKLYNKFIIVSWKNILIIFLRLLYNKRKNIINIFLGPYNSLNIVTSLKSFFTKQGSTNIYYLGDKLKTLPDFRSQFLLNMSVQFIEYVLLAIFVGTNPRLEAPLVNSLFRKSYLRNNTFKVFLLGVCGVHYLTYPVINLGSSLTIFSRFLKGTLLASRFLMQPDNNDVYFVYNKPLYRGHFYIGQSLFKRSDCDSLWNCLLHYFTVHAYPLKQIHVFNQNLGRTSFLEIGGIKAKLFQQQSKKNILNFFIDVDYLPSWSLYKTQVINFYQGSFLISEKVAQCLNILLPAKLYTETSLSYINLEGRYRNTLKAITSFKEVKDANEIVIALTILGKYLHETYYKLIESVEDIDSWLNQKGNYCLDISKKIPGVKQQEHWITKVPSNTPTANSFVQGGKYYDIFRVEKYFKFKNTLIPKSVYNYYTHDIFTRKSKACQLAINKMNTFTFDNNDPKSGG